MFYLIGLGLDEKSISVGALESVRNSDIVYLENYTVDFPYSLKDLEKVLKVKIVSLKREEVENMIFLKEAKNKDVSLLVYGDSLSATTHISIIQECKKQKIKNKVFHNSSILTAIAESGLQLYKFGKTASMPSWNEHKNKPTSFVNYIKDNQKIRAHTLLLVDIGLEFSNAVNQLKESVGKIGFQLNKVVVISKAGTDKQKIFYDKLENMNKRVEKPFVFIIPSELHFTEEEFLSSL